MLKLMTSNDHERRDGRYFALFHRIRQLLGAKYVTFIEVRPTMLATEMFAKNPLFYDICFVLYCVWYSTVAVCQLFNKLLIYLLIDDLRRYSRIQLRNSASKRGTPLDDENQIRSTLRCHFSNYS